MKKHTILFLLLGFLGQILKAQQPCNPPLGATLAPLGWNLNPSNWFVDYMKMSRPGFATVSGPWDPGMATTNSEGWPIEPFSVWVKLGVYAQDEGIYHLEFEGFAQVSSYGQHLISDLQYDVNTNKTSAKLHVTQAADQIALKFEAPMSPVIRHIKLISPGFDPNNHPTFHPDWVEHVSRFPVLRFMNWNAANFNTSEHWSDRNSTDSPTQCPSYFTVSTPIKTPGVAWEYVTELANLTGADIWISVPINATDDYVQQLALFLKLNLQPAAKIYVELSNEVWNDANYPFHHNLNATMAEIQAGGSNLNADGASNPEQLSARRYARRSKEIGAIMATAIGPNTLFTKIFPVFGHHVASAEYTLSEPLEFIKSQYGSPSQYFWGLAGAPFLNGNTIPTIGLTRDVYFQFMQQQLGRMFGSTDNFLDAGVSFATYYNLKYMAHEAGTDTYFYGTQHSTALRDTIAAAQDDPRMKSLIEEYLGNWFRYGGKDGVFTWFVAGATDWHFGDTYGLVNDRLNLNNAKTQAIDNILSDECPFQNVGHLIPGIVDTRQFVQYPSNWDADPFNGMMFQGNTHQYLLNVSDSCLYQCALITEKATSGPAKFEVLLNDVAIDTLVIPESQGVGVDTYLLKNMALSQGLHTLRLKYLTWCYGTHALIFSPLGGCAVATSSPDNTTFHVFPNPASRGFHIQGDEKLKGSQLLQINDVLGRSVMEKAVEIEAGTPIWIDTQLLPGVYFVRIGSNTERLVLER